MSARYTPFLLLYAMYTNNYRGAVNTLQRLRKTPSIDKWLNECVVVVMSVVMMAATMEVLMMMKLVVAAMVKAS